MPFRTHPVTYPELMELTEPIAPFRTRIEERRAACTLTRWKLALLSFRGYLLVWLFMIQYLVLGLPILLIAGAIDSAATASGASNGTADLLTMSFAIPAMIGYAIYAGKRLMWRFMLAGTYALMLRGLPYLRMTDLLDFEQEAVATVRGDVAALGMRLRSWLPWT